MENKQLKIDLQKDTGLTLKPYHGVTNGPLYSAGNKSLVDEYKEIGVPSVRLHNTYGAYTRLVVDVSKIFPVFEADENDPENYYFAHTDQLLQAIIDSGAEIVYRLGESIDHSIYAHSAKPPKDFEKWARICINMIRHFNDGWADGHRFNIRYFEIWNEPEGVNTYGRQTMWRGGTLESAFELYKVIALKIKEYDPNLKVGGMSFISCNQPMEKFVKFCIENKLPLDFVSNHSYGWSAIRLMPRNEMVKKLLDENGYDVEWLLDEWNFYDDISWQRKEGESLPMPPPTKEQTRKVYEDCQGLPGATYCAMMFTFLQGSVYTHAHYYDPQPGGSMNALFDPYGIKRKGFYVFKAYGEMYRGNRTIREKRVDFDKPYRAFTALATDGYVLVGNYEQTEKAVALDLTGADGAYTGYEILLVDETHDLTPVQAGTLVGGGAQTEFTMQPFSVAFVKLK